MTPLNCAGCRACCLHERIELHPELGDDPSLYKTETDKGKIYFAPRVPGKIGPCQYLGATGCTIYEKRPALCRSFDCRTYMTRKLAGSNREQRRALEKRQPWLRAIWAAARSRMPA